MLTQQQSQPSHHHGTRAVAVMHTQAPSAAVDAARRAIDGFNRDAAAAAEAALRSASGGLRSSVAARQVAARIRATPCVAVDTDGRLHGPAQHRQIAAAARVPVSKLIELRRVGAPSDEGGTCEGRGVPVFVADLRTAAASSVVRDGWGAGLPAPANADAPGSDVAGTPGIVIVLTPAGVSDDPSVAEAFAAAANAAASDAAAPPVVVLPASDVSSGVGLALHALIATMDAASTEPDVDAADTDASSACRIEEWLLAAADDPTVWPLDAPSTRVVCHAVRRFQQHQRHAAAAGGPHEGAEDPIAFVRDAAALLRHFERPEEWAQFARTVPGGMGLSDAGHRACYFRLRGVLSAVDGGS